MKANILILGGTTEAVNMANRLKSEGRGFYLSTATEYGYNYFNEIFPEETIMERFNENSLVDFIKTNGIQRVIDCTHPYAEQITVLALSVCKSLNIEYENGSREIAVDMPVYYEKCITVSSIAEAAHAILEAGLKRPLFTTGSKDLSFMDMLKGMDVFVRMLPFEDSIKACVERGIKRKNIIAMHGPFTRGFDEALIKHLAVDCVVTKKTGREGGFYEKLEAARACGVWFIVYEITNC